MKVECWWFLHDVERPVQASQVKSVIQGPDELGVEPNKLPFREANRSLWAELAACVEKELKGHVNLQARRKLGRERQNNCLLNPGAVFAERSGWHSKHLCVPWQSRKSEGRSGPLQHDTLFSCCQIRATLWSTSVHGGRMIMALQGFSCTHEPWISWLVMSTSQMCIRDHMPGVALLHRSNKR